MSVYRRMFGRELPCSTQELLGLPYEHIDMSACEQIAGQMQLGTANSDALYRLGLYHLNRLEPGLARRCFNEALRRWPDSGANRMGLAVACEMLAQHEQAAACLDALAGDLSAGDASARTVLCAAGLACERGGGWQQAIDRYSRVLSQDPMDTFARQRLVAIHLGRGRIAAAIFHLYALLGSQPGDQVARACLGHLLQLEGRHSEAVWEYEQALCLEPDSWEMPVSVAHELAETESEEQAIGLLERLVEDQPQFADLRMRLGNLYSQRGQDGAARAEYEKALGIYPEYLECHIAVARHELRMGRLEVAADHFHRAKAINDLQVELYMGLAMAQRQLGQESQAAENFGAAGRLAGNSAVLLVQIGLTETADDESRMQGTQLQTDMIEALISRDEMALAEHPGWNDLRVRQGMMLRLLGRSEDAYTVLRRAALVDPACREAWMHLGLALNDLGRKDEAASAFANTMMLEERWADLHYRLGLACCDELEFDLAMEKMQEASTCPEDAERSLWLTIEALQMSGVQSAPLRSGRGIEAVREEN